MPILSAGGEKWRKVQQTEDGLRRHGMGSKSAENVGSDQYSSASSTPPSSSKEEEEDNDDEEEEEEEEEGKDGENSFGPFNNCFARSLHYLTTDNFHEQRPQCRLSTVSMAQNSASHHRPRRHNSRRRRRHHFCRSCCRFGFGRRCQYSLDLPGCVCLLACVCLMLLLFSIYALFPHSDPQTSVTAEPAPVVQPYNSSKY
ncbi:hypothetical protein GPALN_012448 [Globodera pallida]|nr:hypothetical protein GPALN_012448 [Globodera pallida]